jgi:ankyrin repeat protein
MTATMTSYGDGNSLFDALSRGVDPNRPEHCAQTPLILAAVLGRVEIVHLLLDRRASIHAKVIWASTSGHLAVVQERIKRGAEINAASNAGMTPMLAAIMSDQFGIARHLVAAGADVNLAAANGITPLIAAIGEGRTMATDSRL